MKALSRLLTMVVMALTGVTTFAQSYPNGLSTDSVDPEADKVFIDIMRSRMEKIHVDEGRPTVALVLSGGGAKGSAHVGVLKVLEELEIPVDMICGTSMGGLVGGLYAMGYPASKLDSLLRAQDWDVTLTDKVAPYYISYATKDYQSKYLFAIPFHYEKPAVKVKKQSKEVRYRNRHNDLNLDADAGDFNTQAGVNTLASSLPSGYVYGFNVNNLISSLTVGYQDDISFTDLPVPYFAVASDVVSCKAKYWGNGSVKSAIRSTMSIPGMFDPVWTDDLVLVDGGTRNNFPVDLARTMGADYVIGVDLSTTAPDYSEVNNLGNILMQFIKMLGQDAFDKNKPEVDVFIKPDLDGYNMLSFNPVAIDTMINRGYMAAKAHMQELMDIKYMMNGAHPRLNNHPAVDISETPVNLSSIEFSGLTNAESRILMRKIKSDVGRTVTKDNLDVAMQKLQATQAFESITYSLYGDQEPYRLVFDGVKGPVHRVGAGLRVDNQEWASILLNIGLNSNKLKGSKLDLESCINKNFYTTLHYSLDLPQVPTLNAEVRYFTNDLDYYSDDAGIIFNTAFNGHKEAVYFSNIKWTAFDMKIGVQSTHFNTKKLMGNGFSMGGSGIQTEDTYLTGTVQSAFINSTIYTLDDPYYPTRGMNMNIYAEWPMYYSCYSEGQDKGPIASIDYSQVHGHGNTVRLVTDLHARSIVGKTPVLHYANFIGGALAGRYWDQQIPFVGTNHVYAAERQIAAGNLELRISPFKNFYVSALGGAFITSDKIRDMFDPDSSTWAYGFGGQLGYNTIIGPVRVRANWSNLFKEVEYYISLGFDF